MSTKKNDVAQSASATVTYCDKLNASRSLFMANGRELKVLRARLEISADDAEALAYLDARSDIARLEA